MLEATSHRVTEQQACDHGAAPSKPNPGTRLRSHGNEKGICRLCITVYEESILLCLAQEEGCLSLSEQVEAAGCPKHPKFNAPGRSQSVPTWRRLPCSRLKMANSTAPTRHLRRGLCELLCAALLLTARRACIFCPVRLPTVFALQVRIISNLQRRQQRTKAALR